MRTTVDGSRATAPVVRFASVSSAVSPISAPGPATDGGIAPFSATSSNEPSCTT